MHVIELDIGWVNMRKQERKKYVREKSVVWYQGGTQRAHDVTMTSYQRRCDVMQTSI